MCFFLVINPDFPTPNIGKIINKSWDFSVEITIVVRYHQRHGVHRKELSVYVDNYFRLILFSPWRHLLYLPWQIIK
jgi:HD-like signal output (HDOD) protein